MKSNFGIDVIVTGNGSLIRTPAGRYFQISSVLGDVILALNEDPSATPIRIQENLRAKGFEYSIENANCLIEASKELVATLPEKDHIRMESFLSIKYKILNKKTIERITSLFSPLFRPPIFSVLSMLSLSCLISLPFVLYAHHFLSFSSWTTVIRTLTAKDLLLLYCFSVGSSVLHEIGHASSLRFFKKTCSEIGIGFYLIFMVLYSDVSAAWELDRYEKIQVNLGGIYFQSILFNLLLGIFLISPSLLLLLFVIGTAYSIMMNLLPVLRYDGYWILSDMIQVSNLRQEEEKLFTYYFNKYIKRRATSASVKLNTLNTRTKAFFWLYLTISWGALAIATGFAWGISINLLKTFPSFLRDTVTTTPIEFQTRNYWALLNTGTQVLIHTFVLVGLVLVIGRSVKWARKIIR